MVDLLTRLYVVATPIGNLGDISSRAITVLGDVALIAAEDTRHTGQLLKHLGVATPMMRLDDHSERQSMAKIVQRVLAGENVALVSDAGTPLISDPGYLLVNACMEAGIEVVPIPGPSSVTTALSVSGLPTDKFVFEGFLSSKATARREQLKALLGEPRTMVLFEAPHRIEASVKTLAEVFGDDRLLCICRELTKTYEQIVSRPLGELVRMLNAGEIPSKGEFVLVLAGAQSDTSFDADRLLRALLAELPPARAAAVAAGLTDHTRKTLYDRAMVIKAQAD
ncbi:MAG: 16S rRNA (cytidine1402-2'-O)-methyltransferase [Candidatus Azotimanducaceae bacterium]|jgi:16S rRNA (cytidine1402-2'-O)-methyltransferase